MTYKYGKLFGITFAAILALPGCGSDNDKDEKKPIHDPLLVETLPPDEKEKYCFIKTEPEDQRLRNELIDSLKGIWTHYPAQARADYKRREFLFDTDAKHATVTHYSYWKKTDNISFNKVCLSKPLDSSFGPY
jgi:hypothetical protein